MIERWNCEMENGEPMMHEDSDGTWMYADDVLKLFEELYQLSCGIDTHGTALALVHKVHHQMTRSS